jgi:glycosyltransferase involved in cell wall biosynthesis
MSQPIKICHLTSVHPVFDTRIFHKECVSLCKAGYEVFLVAPHNRVETVEGVKIVPARVNKLQRASRMTLGVYAVYQKAIKIDAALYHFHDPELIPAAIMLKLRGKKVVYDVHEDLPGDIFAKPWLGPYFIRKIVSRLAGYLEKLPGFWFDGIITVTPDILARFPDDKTILLRNLPVKGLIDPVPQGEKIVGKHVFIYAGGLTRLRGIKQIIEAVSRYNGTATLLLAGNWESDQFEIECSTLEGFGNCRYLGNLKPEQVYACMKSADIGLVVLHPQENFFVSYPVKAFEYMACRLPMVMSEFPLWKKMFHECAEFANPMMIDDIEAAMRRITDNPEHAAKLSEKGRQLIDQKYCWENEFETLFSLYSKILA